MQITSTVHRAFGPSKGKSAYARLQLTGGLPGALPATAPIIAWSRAIWDELVPIDLLMRAWWHAIVAVGADGGRPGGPAGAAVFAAKRLNWAFPHWAVLKEAHGYLLDCRVEAPKTVERAAADAFELVSAEQSWLATRMGSTPSLEALGDFQRSSHWSPSVKGSLRALAEGGWWSRQRLLEAGLTDSAVCAACGAASSSFRHWSCHCPCSLNLMQSVGKDVQDTVTSATTSCVPDTLLDYDVPERLHARLPPPAVVRAVGADGNDVPLKAVRFAGEAFSDGSLLSPQPRGARRGDWAAIGVSADGKVQHRSDWH